MDDILGLSRPKTTGEPARIKDLVRARLTLDEAETLMVSELRCHEDGCPDIETVVAVIGAGGARRSWKLAKPMAAIEAADLDVALAAAPD